MTFTGRNVLLQGYNNRLMCLLGRLFYMCMCKLCIHYVVCKIIWIFFYLSIRQRVVVLLWIILTLACLLRLTMVKESQGLSWKQKQSYKPSFFQRFFLHYKDATRNYLWIPLFAYCPINPIRDRRIRILRNLIVSFLNMPIPKSTNITIIFMIAIIHVSAAALIITNRIIM